MVGICDANKTSELTDLRLCRIIFNAEGENWIDEECVECGKEMQHRMITTVDFIGGVGCNACGGGVCESCDENALNQLFRC